MASLIMKDPAICANLAHFAQNPLFAELQMTLVEECQQQTKTLAPLQGLLYDLPVSREQERLHDEFRCMASYKDPKVTELETFYNTQSTTIEMERHDALGRLSFLDPMDVEAEICYLHSHYDQQQEYLVRRISGSLQLLKTAIQTSSALSAAEAKANKARTLNPKAIAIMSEWYQRHIEHPYPTDDEKQIIADRGAISVAQVKGWFANKRNRSLNTKPKRQKRQMEQKLFAICNQLSSNERPADVYRDIISQLSDVLMTSEMSYR